MPWQKVKMPRVVLVSNIRNSDTRWYYTPLKEREGTTDYDMKSYKKCYVYGLTPNEEESLLKAVSDTTLDQDTLYRYSPESSFPCRTLDEGTIINDFPESILSQLYSFGYEIICCNSHPIRKTPRVEVLWTLVNKNC